MSNHQFSISQSQFSFDLEGETLNVVGSNITGKEQIWLGDRLISQKYSLRKRSLHQIEVNQQPYDVKIEVISLWKGILGCSILKDGVEVQSHTMNLEEERDLGNKPKLSWRSLALVALGGALIGYITAVVW